MGRRKKYQKEIENKQQELERLKQEYEALVAKEEEERQDVVNKIKALEGDKYFIGCLLDLETIVSIIKLYMETGEAVRVPFNVYIDLTKEEKEE